MRYNGEQAAPHHKAHVPSQSLSLVYSSKSMSTFTFCDDLRQNVTDAIQDYGGDTLGENWMCLPTHYEFIHNTDSAVL